MALDVLSQNSLLGHLIDAPFELHPLSIFAGGRTPEPTVLQELATARRWAQRKTQLGPSAATLDNSQGAVAMDGMAAFEVQADSTPELLVADEA
jgi:hypothetical protein